MSTVRPENQIDHRTTRKTKDPATSAVQRAKRQERKAAGLCTVCGVVHVKNRSTCKKCSDKTKRFSERSVFRKYGVPFPPELMTEDERFSISVFGG